MLGLEIFPRIAAPPLFYAKQKNLMRVFSFHGGMGGGGPPVDHGSFRSGDCMPHKKLLRRKGTKTR